MSEIVQTKSELTRVRILRAAARTFRQHGYTAASLRDIADQAELKAGSLYYHFASKEELAEAVMDEGVMGARRRAEQAVAELMPGADALAVEAAFRGHLNYLLEEADFAVATLRMLHQTPDAVRNRHMRKQRAFGRFYARLFRLFERARAAGLIRPEFDRSALRMLLLGALNWSPEWFDADGLTADQLVLQLGHLMPRGLVPATIRGGRQASRSRLQG